MQQTTFRFEVIVNDDASTDGTAAIIRDYAEKYPSIIKPIYQSKNLYKTHKDVLTRLMNSRMRGKYIAMCEGDDYWTDPLKLQKQVDFLEAHPDYSMCFHNAVEHWEDGSRDDALFSSVEERDYTGPEIYGRWMVPTASVVFRRSVIDSALYRKASANKKIFFGDIRLFLTCAAMGRMRGMSDVMSVYRRHEGGMAYSQSFERQGSVIKHNAQIPKTFGRQYKPYAKESSGALYGARVATLWSRRDYRGTVTEFLRFALFSPRRAARFLKKLISYKLRK